MKNILIVLALTASLFAQREVTKDIQTINNGQLSARVFRITHDIYHAPTITKEMVADADAIRVEVEKRLKITDKTKWFATDAAIKPDCDRLSSLADQLKQ